MPIDQRTHGNSAIESLTTVYSSQQTLILVRSGRGRAWVWSWREL